MQLRLRRLKTFEKCVEGDATVYPRHCSLTTTLGVDGEIGQQNDLFQTLGHMPISLQMPLCGSHVKAT